MHISSVARQSAQATFDASPADPVLSIAGDWQLGEVLPRATDLEWPPTAEDKRLQFDCINLGSWDSSLIIFLTNVLRTAESSGLSIDYSGLPEGAQRLLHLAFAVKAPEGARRVESSGGFFSHMGQRALNIVDVCEELLSFVGELVQAVLRLMRGRAAYQKTDVIVAIQEAGAEAFPIVSLISFLIGMIFAFVGMLQLESFGAGIYTADLVAVAMVREMAPIMTGIIMAGRTGAGYAAHLGTMKVNEEIDALTTLGIDPIDFLVLPRVIALVVMMPLLTLYGSLMGIIGGMVVGLSMLDASVLQYAVQTENAVSLNSLFGGLFKAIVYGFLVAIAGCQQGITCGNSAMAVGQATTRAVVNGIVLIVVSASILTIIYINLDI